MQQPNDSDLKGVRTFSVLQVRMISTLLAFLIIVIWNSLAAFTFPRQICINLTSRSSSQRGMQILETRTIAGRGANRSELPRSAPEELQG